MPKERGETGQYVETVAPEDVLEVFELVDGPRVVTSADVADTTGLSRESARRKLEELKQRGDVDSRRAAGRVLYWRTADIEPAGYSDAPRRSEAPAGEPDRTAATNEPPRESAQPPAQVTGTDSLADVEFPGSRDRDRCESAVLAVRDYLREHGPATMREIVADVMPAHPIGYDVPELEPGERYRGAWWRLVVKPGLKALPEVEAPRRGVSDWRHTSKNADS